MPEDSRIPFEQLAKELEWVLNDLALRASLYDPEDLEKCYALYGKIAEAVRNIGDLPGERVSRFGMLSTEVSRWLGGEDARG